MCLQTENLSVHDMEYDGRGYESERNSSVEIPGASNAFPESSFVRAFSEANLSDL
jgi:hypothetical protein